MRHALTATAAALALVGTSLAAAAPAEARDWHGGWHGGYHGGYHDHYYRGGGAGWAVGAGLLGLAAGAALASPRYYDGPAYYAPPPPPPGYYGYGYCHTEWRWDGYRGNYVPVRYCD